MEIKVDVSQAVDSLRREFYYLSKRELNRKIAMALNESGNTARTVSGRLVREHYPGIKLSTHRQGVKIDRANSSKLEVKLVGIGKPIPIEDLRPYQTKKGVTYRIKKNRDFLAQAFINKGKKSGVNRVLARGEYTRFGNSGFTFAKPDAKPRPKINRLYSLSIPGILLTKNVGTPTKDEMIKKFENRARHIILRAI